jgi:hypothetical protein
MKGDFSRFTYNPLKNYLSVLKQQGRVELDSDWNEQSDIILETFRKTICDILGPFAIAIDPDSNSDNSKALSISDLKVGAGGIIDFKIGRGFAYIGGYPYQLPQETRYSTQQDFPEPEITQIEGDILVYLEAWERSISYIDDDMIRETALGGPDTDLRNKLIGQVKIKGIDGIDSPSEACRYLDTVLPSSNIHLTLQIEQSSLQTSMSFGEIEIAGGIIPSNLHYRIELHRGLNSDGTQSDGFKWSDENGAIAVRALKALDTRHILIEELEQVTGESLKQGDWVEVTNMVTELRRSGSQMAKIESLETASGGLVVTLDSDIHPILTRRKNGVRSGLDQGLAPRLRRWSGYVAPLTLKTVYDLGRGIKAIFGCGEKKPISEPADYWTYAIRDRDYNKLHAPQKALPQGIKKYSHPLAIIRRDGEKTVEIIDCRRFFKPITYFASKP